MSPRAREEDAIISKLLRASIGLQKALDRCFSSTGLTSQEAAVLLHCAEAKGVSAGKLAQAMGRDKGKITRFVDRLEARGFVQRVANSSDHRLLIIRPTVRGQRAVPELKRTFEQIRGEILTGVQRADLIRVGSVLPHYMKTRVGFTKTKLLVISKEPEWRVAERPCETPGHSF